MGSMKLGGYTFEWDPDKWTIPKSTKSQAWVKTYTGVEFFSWGLSIAGKQIDLEWEWMSEAQFEVLTALYEQDVAFTWVPGDGNSYLVELLRLTGEYFEVVGLDLAYRKNVVLSLLVRSYTTATTTTTSTASTTTSSASTSSSTTTTAT